MTVIDFCVNKNGQKKLIVITVSPYDVKRAIDARIKFEDNPFGSCRDISINKMPFLQASFTEIYPDYVTGHSSDTCGTMDGVLISPSLSHRRSYVGQHEEWDGRAWEDIEAKKLINSSFEECVCVVAAGNIYRGVKAINQNRPYLPFSGFVFHTRSLADLHKQMCGFTKLVLIRIIKLKFVPPS